MSCQKEITGDKEIQQQCRIVKGVYTLSGGSSDSAQFIYDDWGNVVKCKTAIGHYDYLYEGSNINVLTFKNNSASDLLMLDSIRYDEYNAISEISFYDYTELPFNLKHHRTIFIYDNYTIRGLMKITYVKGQPDTSIINFTWNADGNVQKMTCSDMAGGVIENVTYQYNTMPNYFKTIHRMFFLFDPKFGLNDEFESRIPLYYSRNNVIQLNQNGTNQNLTYYFDSKNRFTGVNLGGNQNVSYSYQCQ
jgi:hypothetical protein